MLVDLDSLKGAARRQSVKYRFLARGFDIRRLPQEYAWEIAVLLNTPGISVMHVCCWMGWGSRFWKRELHKLKVDDPEIIAAGVANADSITLEDGRDMLMALIVTRRRWHGMPVAATMWLRTRWHEDGLSVAEIARELGVTSRRVGLWLHGNGFEAELRR